VPSFDVVSEVNLVEVRNALDQCNKEVSNRFDFKGSDARVEFTEKDKLLTVYADDEFKLGQVKDVLNARLAKRNIDLRMLDPGSIQKIGGDKVKHPITLKMGIDTELGKKVVRAIKDSKLKVQAAIQADTVRVTGAKKDTLQDAIALLRKTITEIPLQYKNFRD